MWDIREEHQCEKRPPLRAFAVRGYISLKAPSCPWGASLGPLGAIPLKTDPFFASRGTSSEWFRGGALIEGKTSPGRRRDSEIRDSSPLGLGTWDLGLETRDLRLGTWDLGLETWDLRLGTWDLRLET